MSNTKVFHVVWIDWDTDGKRIKGLPKKINIPVEGLMFEDEVLGENVELEELKDRIADYLSDEYGWCINSLRVEN